MTRNDTGPAPAVALPPPKERRRLRRAKELSEEQVATALGVTPATIRAWETGRTDPRGRRLAAYARLLGCVEHVPVPDAPARDAPTPDAPAADAPVSDAPAPDAPAPDEVAQGEVAQAEVAQAEVAQAEVGAEPAEPVVPQPREGLTAEEAYDALYDRIAPGLIRQMYLLTGRRKLAREAVEHAFRSAWHRWPEVARDRDPAGWVRAASYEYAMSPWHQLRRSQRRADALPKDPAQGELLDALLRLPPAARRTLLLHDGVGLGLPEIAAETEASTPATASRLMNARAAVTERLPQLAQPPEPGAGPPLLHKRLGELALLEEVPAPPPAPAVRAGSERLATLWTRAALCFGMLLIGTTTFTLQTAPTRYEQPLAPAERVGGIPVLSGPEKLTPQDLELQKSLRGELMHGPERLVPRIP